MTFLCLADSCPCSPDHLTMRAVKISNCVACVESPNKTVYSQAIVYGSRDYYNVGTSILFTYTWQWVFSPDNRCSEITAFMKLCLTSLDSIIRGSEDLILSNPYVPLFAPSTWKLCHRSRRSLWGRSTQQTSDELFNTLKWASIKII